MTLPLTDAVHEHHGRILVRVDRMPALADELTAAQTADTTAELVALREFLGGTLIPHMEAAERGIYPVLERLLQNRHSMRPMRSEHDAIRRLVGEYSRVTGDLPYGRISLGNSFRLRRVIFQLYALIKVHLSEEEAYLRIIDRGGGAEMGDLLAATLEHPIAG